MDLLGPLTSYLADKPGLTLPAWSSSSSGRHLGQMGPMAQRIWSCSQVTQQAPCPHQPPPPIPQLLLSPLPVTHDFPSSRKNKQTGLGPSRGRLQVAPEGRGLCSSECVCMCIMCIYMPVCGGGSQPSGKLGSRLTCCVVLKKWQCFFEQQC